MHPVVDPDLYPDLAHLGLGLPEAVIYVRIERVQRNSPLGDCLLAAHLAAALADDYAGARGMDVDRDLALLGGFADLDVRYACPAQLLLDVVPDLEVLTQ